MSEPQEFIPLPEAALRSQLSWPQAWGKILRGEWVAEKRRGRWYVSVASVDRMPKAAPADRRVAVTKAVSSLGENSRR